MRAIPSRLTALIAASGLVLAAGCGSSDEGSTTPTGGKPRTATFGGPDSGRPIKPTDPK